MIYLMPNIKVSELKRYFKNSLFFLSVIFLSISAFAGTTPPITTFEKEPNSRTETIVGIDNP